MIRVLDTRYFMYETEFKVAYGDKMYWVNKPKLNTINDYAAGDHPEKERLIADALKGYEAKVLP